MFSSKNFYSSASEKSNVKVRHSKKTCQENRKRKHQKPDSACYSRPTYLIYIKIKNLLFAVFVHLLECKKADSLQKFLYRMKSEILNCLVGVFFVILPEVCLARIICVVCKIIIKPY